MTTYRKIVAITPSDTLDLPDGQCQAIWCAGSAGNVRFVDGNGVLVTLPIAAGFDLRITARTQRVYSTSTTATTLYACYL